MRGRDALYDAIRRVWASAFAERAVAYRKSRHLPLDGVEMAVVVQEMIDAEVSGVVFTAEPTTGDTRRIVISSLYGLGEGLVSGGLDADLFTVDKQTGKIEPVVADKSERFVFDRAKQGGVTREPVPADSREKASLTDSQIRLLSETARRIEEAYGAPQDIEFAIDRGGELAILQTRPITTIEEYGPAAGYGLLWDNSNIIESFSGVTSPLTFSVIRRSYATVYRCFSEVMGIAPGTIRQSEPLYQNMLGLIRGRVYYNLRSWYLLLRLFPGFEYNRQFMESMMGVKESYQPERPSPPRRCGGISSSCPRCCGSWAARPGTSSASALACHASKSISSCTIAAGQRWTSPSCVPTSSWRCMRTSNGRSSNSGARRSSTICS